MSTAPVSLSSSLSSRGPVDSQKGLAPVRSGNKSGYIDHSGAFAINPQFDAVTEFKHGFALVKLGNNRAIIDKSGKFVLNPGQLTIMGDDISDGLVAVRSENGLGYAQSSGEWTIPPTRALGVAGPVHKGIAAIRVEIRVARFGEKCDPTSSPTT
ncbi:MAG TPA: WG repeat-containing protein [Candidatus Angelobacter sp.]